jgi:hypothetical protein
MLVRQSQTACHNTNIPGSTVLHLHVTHAQTQHTLLFGCYDQRPGKPRLINVMDVLCLLTLPSA